MFFVYVKYKINKYNNAYIIQSHKNRIGKAMFVLKIKQNCV